MLTLGPIDVMVLDETNGNVYHFTSVAEIFEALDITPSELVYGFHMPNGTAINDRYSFHKIYIGDLEKLSKDIVIIKPDRTAMIVSNIRMAAIVTGYDIASIAYSLDTDGGLDLPYRFVSMSNYLKTMGDSFNRQLQAMKPQPNMEIKPDKQTLFKILSQLEKFTDELERPKPVFLPTQPIGKTNEVDPGEYIEVDNAKYAKNLTDGPAQNFVQKSLSNLKLVDLSTGEEVFFNSYAQVATFFKSKGMDFSNEELKNMRKNQTIVDNYLIKMAKDDSPVPPPF